MSNIKMIFFKKFDNIFISSYFLLIRKSKYSEFAALHPGKKPSEVSNFYTVINIKLNL